MTSSTVEQLNQATDAAGGEVVIKQPGATTSQRIAVATEAEILSPTADEPKLVTNVGLNDKLEEFERELGANWGAWSDESTFTTTSGDSGTSTAGTITISRATTYNAKTGTIPAGSDAVLSFDTGNSANNPTLSSGTLRGGLVWDGAGGRRWYYPIDNPESADGEEFFYLDGDPDADDYLSTSNDWVAVPYNGSATETSYGGLPNDSKIYPISSEAHDGPTSNAFDDEADLGLRQNARQTALRIVYDTTNSRFTVVYSERNFAASSGTPSITEEEIYSNASGLSANTGASLSSGKAFADYNEIYVAWRYNPNSALQISKLFSTKQWATTFAYLNIIDDEQATLIVNRNASNAAYALNSFYWDSATDRLLYKIIGRKFS